MDTNCLKQNGSDAFNTCVEISSISILIIVLVTNIPILFSAYRQENTASATVDSGPSQRESNATIKIIIFLILCYTIFAIYRKFKCSYKKYRKRQYFSAYTKEVAIRNSVTNVLCAKRCRHMGL
jgi:hypothetical protein